MAIAFNLPSERQATEESYSRLNRLLAELYDVLCHILVSRQPPDAATGAPPDAAATAQPERPDRSRDRPFSDSDIDRPGFSGLPDVVQPSAPRRRSANPLNLPPLADFDFEDDDVFVSPRMDNGNDPFSNPRNVEIFGSPRNASPRTPAGVLLSPRGRLERRFTFSVTSEKHWRDKGGTDEADGLVGHNASDETHSAACSKVSSESDGSILSSILPDKLSGSICTAVLFMLGWKLLASKR